MIFLELRKGNYDDLNIGEIWQTGGAVLIVAVVVCVIIFLISALCINGDYKSEVAYNARAVEYNAMPLADRQLLLQYAPEIYGKADPETYLLKLKPARSIHDEFVAIPHIVWWSIAAILITISSLSMTANYRKQKLKKYFYADFPHRNFIEVLTFCAMYSMLPVMLISWLRMLLYCLDLTKAERREVERLARIEARKNETWQIVPPKVAHCAAADAKRYCNGRVNKAQLYHRQAVEQAEQKVQSVEQELRDLGTRLQLKQRRLNDARSELQSLQTTSSQLISPEQARAELQAIREMRGVSQVTLPKVAAGQRMVLSFIVKVRVPYCNELYDFGDYKITFFTNTYKCQKLRSGVRANATSTRPDYSTSDGFCFGDRKHTILEYVQAGRIVEAATLIVDSLHSVNSQEIEREIPHCFRKVRTVQNRAALIRHQFSRR